MNIKKLIVTIIFTMILTNPIKTMGYSNEELSTINIYEKINPAIVAIDAQIADGISCGTGCIINKSGNILTSSHVIKGCKNVEITTYNGETYKADIIKNSNLNEDLAILKISPKKELQAITLGNSNELKVGQKILAIGNPFGFNGTLTQGIISRIDYSKNKIQTDAAINPGSSGGPILNTQGEVIGISQSIYNPDNNISNIGIGFAIPSNTVKDFLVRNKFNTKDE